MSAPALLALALLAPPAGTADAPVVTPIAAPAGVGSRPVQWVQIVAPGLGTMRAAVARPAGAGPFPALLILHGTHGFAQEYVQLAQDVAQGGILGIAPCWFKGGGGTGAGAVKPLDVCPDAPAMPGHLTPQSRAIVDALVSAVRSMPDVRAGRVALFGQSRGAGASLHAALGGGVVQALVLNSCGYPQDVVDQIPKLQVPVLMLHGALDGPGDPAGSEVTSAARAHAFEAAAHRARKHVEAHFYESGGHTTFFTRPEQNRDSVARIVAFLHAQFDR